MTRSGHLRRYALFGLAAVLLTVGALWLRAGPLSGDGQGGGRVLNLGGAFALTAGDGRPVTEASWPGHLLQKAPARGGAVSAERASRGGELCLTVQFESSLIFSCRQAMPITTTCDDSPR